MWILRRKDWCSQRTKERWSSLISDEFLQEIEGEIRANRRVTIRESHHIISEVSKTAFHEALTEKLGYRKLCARWLAQNVNGRSQIETDGFRAEVSHALRTGRRWVSGLHCDWRWNMGFPPHSWIQATMMMCKKKSWRGPKGRRQTSVTRGYKLVPILNKYLDNAGDYVEK